MLPVCKAAGTISAPAMAELRTTAGASVAATAVPLRLSGQLNKRIVKQAPRLMAKNVTETARSRSRRVCHIMHPHIARIQASLAKQFAPNRGNYAAKLGRDKRLLRLFRCGSISPSASAMRPPEGWSSNALITCGTLLPTIHGTSQPLPIRLDVKSSARALESSVEWPGVSERRPVAFPIDTAQG